MNSDLVSRNETTKELVIIRRRADPGLETSHSGIWKIAYADFMTAMMAFFLVMWLLNATDKQTIAAVANYFNPVKLTDRVSDRRGLHDRDGGAGGAQDARPQQKGSPDGDPMRQGSFQPTYQEDALFRSPYVILAELAAKA